MARPCPRHGALLRLAGARARSSLPTWVVAEDEAHQEAVLPYSAVPGPKPLPLLGNTWRFIPYIGDYRIEELAKVCERLFAQYGPVVKITELLGRPDMLFVFDADIIERVFRAEDAHLPVRPSMPSLNAFKHGIRKDFFGDLPGVIAVHGEKWLDFRSRVQQVMLQPRTAKLYVTPIEDTAEAFVKRMKHIRSSNGELPPDFLNEIHKWSLESIARVALDTELGCLDDNPPDDTQKLIDAVGTFFKNVGILELKSPVWRIFPTPTWKAYIGALDDITNITSKHILKALTNAQARGRELGPDASLLQRVLAMDQDAKTAHILAIDLFLVGIDTTSAALASTLYQLSRHTQQQEELHEEVLRVLGPKGSVTAAALQDMPYLRAVVKETLRMCPVVIGNGRTLTEDTVIGGYRIPRGTQVVFQHYVVSNQERYFPQADKFLPGRWLREAQDQTVSTHPFATLPFGFGRRMCLGRRFAELELHTVVAKIVQSFQLRFYHQPLPYRICPMYMPDGPLQLTLIDRYNT